MRHVRPAPKPPVFPTNAPGGLDLRPFDGARAKILRRRCPGMAQCNSAVLSLDHRVARIRSGS